MTKGINEIKTEKFFLLLKIIKIKNNDIEKTRYANKYLDKNPKAPKVPKSI